MCFRRACSRSLSAVPGPRRFTILNPRPSHQTIVANRPAAFRLQRLDDSEQPDGDGSTRERRLFSQDQEVERIAVLRKGAGDASKVKRKGTPHRQDLVQAQETRVVVVNEFVPAARGSFDDGGHQVLAAVLRIDCVDLESSHGPILHPPGRVVNFHTVWALVVATVLDVYSPTAATHGNPMNGKLSRAGVPPPAISRPYRDDLGGSSLHGTTKVAALLCLVV